MERKQFVRRFAGLVITAGFLGGWFIHDYLYFIDLFAGLNLLQSSFTGFCPPEKLYESYLKP